MGKEIRVLCDCCGKDVYGKEYFTLAIRRVKNSKQTKFPTVWLCRECFLKTNIKLLEKDDNENLR